MHARALICDEQQNFTLEDVVLPDAGPDNVVVRTLYTGVSIGTEFALIRNKISWGPYPICTGYQGVGVLEHVGDHVTGFEVGQTVYYRDNRTIELAGGQKVSAVAGTHCSHAVADPAGTHGLAVLPDGVDPEPASLFVLPAVGLNGVDMANPRMGDTVVVQGAGLVGLGVIAACSHRGCRVIATDMVPHRLEVAGQLGADVTFNPREVNVRDAVLELTGQGADVVFESTGIPSLIDEAVVLCREHGKFVWQGNYGAAPVSMQFLPAHGRRLTMFFPCDDGLAPCRRAVLKNMAMGALRWELTITHRVQPDEGPALFDSINKGEAPDVLGAVIKWA
jgi:2-desacetyl-2-hydroxyethyl bacteriochlorophyllide A dehydrogenase